MVKEIELHGCVQIQPDMTEEDFWDAFIPFLEERGWYFGGGLSTIVDGYYLNEDGTRGPHVMDGLPPIQ